MALAGGTAGQTDGFDGRLVDWPLVAAHAAASVGEARGCMTLKRRFVEE